jgi:hypothetical protein
MTRIDREHGYIEDSQLDGNTLITVTVYDVQPTTPDLLDRVLQMVLIEVGVDIAWQQPPPVEINPLNAPLVPEAVNVPIPEVEVGPTLEATPTGEPPPVGSEPRSTHPEPS